MKIRIKDNSVRFRLAPSEVTDLVHSGETWSKCQFGTGELIYGLLAADQKEISSEIQLNKIITKVPKATLANWDTDERVGFHHRSDGLFILIEKDWQCLKPRPNEDESKLYVNPSAT